MENSPQINIKAAFIATKFILQRQKQNIKRGMFSQVISEIIYCELASCNS